MHVARHLILFVLGIVLVIHSAFADPAHHFVDRPPYQYELVDLGYLGARSIAIGLNNNGTIVGWAVMSWGQFVGLRVQDEQISAVLGLSPSDATMLRGINDEGVIVGASQPDIWSPYHAFVIMGPDSRAIDLHPAGFDDSVAKAVNSKGRVVINAGSLLRNEAKAFYLDLDVLEKMPFPTRGEGLSSYVNDINHNAIAVGSARTYCTILQTETTLPVAWVPFGDSYSLQALPVGEDPCEGPITAFGEATSINSDDEIAGYVVSASGDNRSAIWQRSNDGVWNVQLGAFGSVLYDLNSKREGVGVFRHMSRLTAGLYRNASWRDISQLAPIPSDWRSDGFHLTAINEAGDIVGDGRRLIAGVYHDRAVLFKRR